MSFLSLVFACFVLALSWRSLEAKNEIDVAMSDPEFVRKTANCLIKNEGCNKFGEKAKIVMEEITASGRCKSCNREEQEKAYIIIPAMKARYPEIYNELLWYYMGERGVPLEVPPQLRKIAGDKPTPVAGIKSRNRNPTVRRNPRP